MKRSVVIFSAFATPFRSGAEACAEEVSARLQSSCTPIIITARLRRDLPKTDVLTSGVQVRRVGLGYSLDKWLYPFLAPMAARGFHPDIVHAVLESYAGMALVLSRFFLPKSQRILTCQSTNTRLFLRPMHRAAHRVTAISTVLVERARRFGVDAVLIPNGIDLPALRSACATHQKELGRVLFVGRLESMKGVDTLLQAFARLEQVPCTLRIVGDGTQRAALQRQAHTLGIADRVTFVGRVEAGSVAAEYAQAQVFCGLSRSEALGNVFLEAQAAGCAVVATRIGGIPDIVKHEQTGILVPPDDPVRAAQAIERFLADEPYRSRVAEAGKSNALGYDWGLIAQQYCAIYSKLA